MLYHPPVIFCHRLQERRRRKGFLLCGIIFGSPVDRSVINIDHDQAFQSTSHVQYQPRKNGPWVAFTWRYDSGIVSGAVPDLAIALSLTADQQAQIGFYCGSQVATPGVRSPPAMSFIRKWGAKLVKIPAPGSSGETQLPGATGEKDLARDLRLSVCAARPHRTSGRTQ
jgi:hypothetical protein